MPALANDTFGLPLAKRQKRVFDEKAPEESRNGSKVFAPFRTLGLVSPTPVPFTSVRLGKSTFQITTSVGHSLQTYDLRRGLNLVFLSRPQTPEIITATCAWQDKVFAAWGHLRPRSSGGVWVFKRGKRVASLDSPALDGPIERLVVFGSWVIGCWAGGLEIWKTGSYEHYASLRPRSTPGSLGEQVYVGIMCTMPTYLNKVFVGRSDGAVDIWNLRSGKLLYTMPPPSSDAGPVTAMHPTPALSLLAVAHKTGSLSIHNVDSAQLVLSLRNASTQALPVTSITFRGDGLGAGHDGRKAGVMATISSGSGDITMWDLNDGGRVAGILRGAHRVSNNETGMGVNRVEFLDGQPVLVSSGGDNALKTWIFDETPFSPTPRPLHSRGGHSAAVSALDFVPVSSDGSESGGKWLLSASKDCSFWGLSLRKDSQHAEISQGNLERKAKKMGPSGHSNSTVIETLKAPEITSLACSLNRDGGMGVTTSGPIWSNPKAANADTSNATGWESVVTGHRGDKYARTWFWGKKKAGRWAFATSDGTEVKSVAMSPCGTFAVVGSAGGSIDMFNMQSGLHRQSFPSRSPRSRDAKLRANDDFTVGSSHTKAVTGLMIDNLNRMVISCGLDGKVKFWDLLSGSLIDELDWHPMAAITGLRYSKTSELVAFSCDDLSIRVIDLETRKLVREFWGCVGQVNDFIFSNDGRWIIAASMDSVLRVWDLPTGHLIDIFRVSSTCVSLAMSSTGDFLATAHAGSIGISLWSNRSLFMPVSTKNMDEDAIEDVGVPTSSGESGAGLVEAAFLDVPDQDDSEGPVLATDQLRQDMVTLSLVPKSRWQALLHLDSIRERNRPKEAPKAPEKAPFFLPSLLGTNDAQSASATTTEAAELGSLTQGMEAERSRVSKLQAGGLSSSESPITRLLQSGHRLGNYDPLIEHLKSLPPARADLEIRSLDPRVRSGFSELSGFVNALTMRLKLRRDFELVNAWMAVFLKIHADTVGLCSRRDGPEYRVLQEALASWAHEQEQEGKRLAGLVGYCRGVVGFLRSAR
ncbi:uncharacterized protein N7443_007449 [Penicillium atrosanguineum]|uniref:Small-subunit processome Utp21 domain-containing protein n=1 Tax=Penicillium atrosanguineum TaxID=1132637 RepID=A0A9W9PNE7_9EURO|nr:uncharacterized protein N7443_007449 [Penicillium atrosanguineum]KAJ5296556.1 hypothetical protein N7443_007449 [Penicillium atrosanguineum]KAJ5299319.1 hypothetical protein N7476_010876 [Penicillium atrosanguineum]